MQRLMRVCGVIWLFECYRACAPDVQRPDPKRKDAAGGGARVMVGVAAERSLAALSSTTGRAATPRSWVCQKKRAGVGLQSFGA